ncbi:hypothetical protein N9L02_03385 [Gammaproteobacteria bacterium]|nr:hypothetical protein [Gammaproteobacteria bacterium]
MTLTCKDIFSNEQFVYTGDVELTGSIGQNAEVLIVNGNLNILGNVADGASIVLQQNIRAPLNNSNSLFFNQNNPLLGRHPNLLTVRGNIGSDVKLNLGTANIKVYGNIDSTCKIKTSEGELSADQVRPMAECSIS